MRRAVLPERALALLVAALALCAAGGCRLGSDEGGAPAPPSDWEIVLTRGDRVMQWTAEGPGEGDADRPIRDLWDAPITRHNHAGRGLWLAPSAGAAVLTAFNDIPPHGFEQGAWIARRNHDGSWREIAEVVTFARPRWVAWSGDERTVAFPGLIDAGNGKRAAGVHVVNLSSGVDAAFAIPVATDSDSGLALSDDGSHLAVARAGAAAIDVYETARGTRTRAIDIESGEVPRRVLAWAPAGELLYEVLGSEGSVVVCVTDDGRERYRLTLGDAAQPRAVRPDGGQLFYSVGRLTIPLTDWVYRIVELGSGGDAASLGRTVDESGPIGQACWVRRH